MANFQTAIKKAKRLTPQKVKSDLFKFIRAIEKEFIDLNISQIEDSQNSQGKLLENNDKRFTGFYSESTQGFADLDGISTPKKAGEPYNFLWSGDFLKGFELFIQNETITLFSTGTGAEEKAAFFRGYNHLFGLTDTNLKTIIDGDILPFLLKYYKKELI